MSRRICTGLAAVIISGVALHGTAQAHAARTRIAVLGVTAEQLRAEVREKIAAAIAGGLAASGADVVDSAATTKDAEAKGIRDCETPTCRIAIADATGARYLMRGSVETMGRSYRVHLEMIDGTTGTVIGVREDRCEICTENEAYETASVTASALKAEVVKRPVAASDGTEPRKIGVTDVAYPPVKDLPMVSGNGTTPPPGGEPNPPRMRGWSWAAIGAGAAAIGAGIVLVSIDGQQQTCMRTNGPMELCPHTWTTRGGGIALITGGALAAVLGTALLVGRF
jgi:TolB-like protein